MKCNRRWWNDGRRQLEVDEFDFKHKLTPLIPRPDAQEPFWLWWLATQEAETFRRQEADWWSHWAAFFAGTPSVPFEWVDGAGHANDT